jgi:hypothetical protein
MDSSDEDSEKNKGVTTVVFKRHFVNVINVLSTFWVRYNICDNNEYDRILLNYRSNFLPYFGGILYLIYFITEALK